jgi:glycosyltransferase involved in cell wall biosynthesis
MDSRNIGVVIPVYRRQAELNRALASVNAQTVPASAIVVVDDGSPVPIELEAPFDDDPRVTLVRLPVNLGASGARNAGARLLGTEWVAFLDSDDEWLPHHLATSIPLLDPGVALVVSGFRAHAPTRAHSTDVVPVFGRNPTRQLLRGEHTPLTASSMVTQRALLVEHGFDEGLRVLEDLDLAIRLSTLGLLRSTGQVSVSKEADRSDRLYSRERDAEARRQLLQNWPTLFAADPVAQRRQHHTIAVRQAHSSATKPSAFNALTMWCRRMWLELAARVGIRRARRQEFTAQRARSTTASK